MPRVKRGVIANKRRRAVLKLTKGFQWGRKNKERAAKEALLHALRRKFRGRKEKKRVFRKLWTVRVNAVAREERMSYSRLIDALNKKGVKLNRRTLSDLAENEPAVFKKVIAFVK